jgi:hypothetical protein
MGKYIEGNPWVWVIVVNLRGEEQFLGQQDEERDLSFVPVFLEKEAAHRGMDSLSRQETGTYEVQAIRYDEVSRQVKEKGFHLFVLNEKGRVLEEIAP